MNFLIPFLPFSPKENGLGKQRESAFHSFFLEKEKSGNGREKMFAIIGESDSVYCCGRVIGIVEE